MSQSRFAAQGQSIGGTRGLSGIRVLELGEMVSAPYATKLLADLGADVIKVEPSHGDRARTRGPFKDPEPQQHTGSLFGRKEPAPAVIPYDPDTSGLYLALNTNKRSIVIDPDEQGRQDLAELVAQADIIITNHRAEQLEAIGFDADQIRADRPELVICSITPFGLTGPYAGYRAEELTVTNAGGWAYQCPGASSEPNLPPLKVFGHQTGFHAGMAAATVALAAFDRAERTGSGDHIDFSAMAHTAGMLEAALIAASYMDADPNRLGSRLLNPWKIFECDTEQQIFRDRPKSRFEDLIFLVTVEEDQWERLVDYMGAPEWTETGLFDTLDLRLENEDLLAVFLSEWTRQHSVSELWHGGQQRRICFAPVLTMAAMERQEHLRERGFFVDVDHPVAGRVTHLGPPFLTTPNLWGPLAPAPELDAVAKPAFGPGRPSVRKQRESESRRPLDGIRVLDFSWVWAGPYCTMHLAHLGAEVIKLESSKRPGLGRRLPIHPPEVAPSLNTSAYFNQWGQGKLSCQVDLSHPEAIELVKQLVAKCDVVVENFATGVMEKLGLGYAELAAIKPDIIVASISGYGSTGPLREYIGYGPTTGPLSGLTSLTGYEGGPPSELGIAVGDPGAGITSAFAICAAVVSRRVSGQGCYIDTALWESTASNAVEGWMSHALNGRQPDRIGNRDPLMAPHGCYRTGDLPPSGDRGRDQGGDQPDADQSDDVVNPGLWVSIACSTDEDWFELAAMIEPSLVTDERFTSLADRKENEDALDAIIENWVNGQDRWQLTKRLQAVGIAAFPSMSTKDLLADEHLEARGFFERLHHHEVGRQTHAGVPWLSATSQNGVSRPAPLLGQHTALVLADLLGLDDEQVQDLRERGITG